MALNWHAVKELVKNGFPVISLGLHYNDYQNQKVILKDIVHNVVLKERITGNFEIEIYADYKPIHWDNIRTYSGGSSGSIVSSYTVRVRDYINRLLSDVRRHYRIFVGKTFTLLGIANVYFYLGTITGRDQSFRSYEDIIYYNYSCKYPLSGSNENPTIVRLYSCCEIPYQSRMYCFSGINFGDIFYEQIDATHVTVSSRLFIDMRGRVVASHPVDDIMYIRSALYFLLTFFNFYQVEHAVNYFFGGIPISIPPPFWLVPIGELGFIRYRLDSNEKITYEFLPLTYFYYGIFTYKSNIVSFSTSRVFRRYGYPRGAIGSLYIAGAGCSIPAIDYAEVLYDTIYTGNRDTQVIPEITQTQYLYAFKERYTSKIVDAITTKTGTYYRILTSLNSSCGLDVDEITTPLDNVEIVSRFTPSYYWEKVMPIAYLYRPALVFLTKANRLLYVNPRR